jgi:hypothetical protein
MILVYCDHITERHKYTFDFIFGDILGLRNFLTDKQGEYISYPGPKINYSHSFELKGIHFLPHPILEETIIKDQNIEVKSWNDLPVFFCMESTSEWPFDPFAMTFYLISRYEEYLPFSPDEHGRFLPEQSLAYRNSFLQIPLVNAIAHEMEKLIRLKYPDVEIPERHFRLIPTFDIDIAFAHLGKGAARALAAWMKLFLRMDLRNIRERMSTVYGRMKDPYDNFSLHSDLASKYGHVLFYFVLIADFGRFDRNTSHRNSHFRNLITELKKIAEMGLHPSYRSFLQPRIISLEKQRLENIIREPVTKARFHYLRLKFPESYRLLISEGITDDYSMGYSSHTGFRASTCTPFYFYDLAKEEKTGLKLHPFIFMDSAMIDHMKLTVPGAISAITDIVGQVEKYGGEAIGIWHNYSLSEKDQYAGWRNVLVSVLEHYKTTAP